MSSSHVSLTIVSTLIDNSNLGDLANDFFLICVLKAPQVSLHII